MIRTAVFVLRTSFFVTAVEAGIIPPAEFDTWVTHAGSLCHNPQANTPCDGAEGSLPVEDRTHPTWTAAGRFTSGGGTASANQLAAFVAGNSAFFRLNASVQDTYTLSGPPGDVDITVHLSAEAHARRLFNPPVGQPAGGMFLIVKVGQAIRSDGETIVNVMSQDVDQMPSGTGPLEVDLAAEISMPLTVTANTPFALAHNLELSGSSAAEADALNTAIIDFTVPDGYTLTSELGWTPIPEPSMLALCLSGLAAAAASGRRARDRHRHGVRSDVVA